VIAIFLKRKINTPDIELEHPEPELKVVEISEDDEINENDLK
jgi:hypothetical protein